MRRAMQKECKPETLQPVLDVWFHLRAAAEYCHPEMHAAYDEEANTIEFKATDAYLLVVPVEFATEAF